MQLKPDVLHPGRGGVGALCAAASAGVMAQPAGGAAITRGMDGFAGELVLVALLAACAWTVLYVLRKRRNHAIGGSEPVHVLGITALGPRERIVVLRVRDRTFLLGVTASQITLLAELHRSAAAKQAADDA
jgi:flagellar protein FliO/FliZ